MVTDFEHNAVSPIVLGAGRRLLGLVAKEASIGKVEDLINSACSQAIRGGWFAELDIDGSVAVDFPSAQHLPGRQVGDHHNSANFRRE